VSENTEGEGEIPRESLLDQERLNRLPLAPHTAAGHWVSACRQNPLRTYGKVAGLSRHARGQLPLSSLASFCCLKGETSDAAKVSI